MCKTKTAGHFLQKMSGCFLLALSLNARGLCPGDERDLKNSAAEAETLASKEPPVPPQRGCGQMLHPLWGGVLYSVSFITSMTLRPPI